MGEVAFHYTPGAEMIADGLTKALAGSAFIPFRDGMGMYAGAPAGGEHSGRL